MIMVIVPQREDDGLYAATMVTPENNLAWSIIQRIKCRSNTTWHID